MQQQEKKTVNLIRLPEDSLCSCLICMAAYNNQYEKGSCEALYKIHISDLEFTMCDRCASKLSATINGFIALEQIVE